MSCGPRTTALPRPSYANLQRRLFTQTAVDGRQKLGGGWPRRGGGRGRFAVGSVPSFFCHPFLGFAGEASARSLCSRLHSSAVAAMVYKGHGEASAHGARGSRAAHAAHNTQHTHTRAPPAPTPPPLDLEHEGVAKGPARGLHAPPALDLAELRQGHPVRGEVLLLRKLVLRARARRGRRGVRRTAAAGMGKAQLIDLRLTLSLLIACLIML